MVVAIIVLVSQVMLLALSVPIQFLVRFSVAFVVLFSIRVHQVHCRGGDKVPEQWVFIKSVQVKLILEIKGPSLTVPGLLSICLALGFPRV